MARRDPAARLAEVAEAARRVFTQKGYRRTLISDVADELGLSHGALYGYVESKKALFHIAMRCAIGREWIDEQPVLPVATPAPGATLDLLDGWTPETMFPELEAALSRRRVSDVRAELSSIFDEWYTAIEENHRLLALIERSATDLPDLAERYFGSWRGNRIADLRTYLTRRIRSGHLRQVPDVDIATRFVVESIAWFAWHRKDDRDGAAIDDELARATVRQLVVSGFVAPRAPNTTGGGGRRG